MRAIEAKKEEIKADLETARQKRQDLLEGLQTGVEEKQSRIRAHIDFENKGNFQLISGNRLFSVKRASFWYLSTWKVQLETSFSNFYPIFSNQQNFLKKTLNIVLENELTEQTARDIEDLELEEEQHIMTSRPPVRQAWR